jgi:hypothetical protein
MEVFDYLPGLPEHLMLGSGPEALSVAADDRLSIPPAHSYRQEIRLTMRFTNQQLS